MNKGKKIESVRIGSVSCDFLDDHTWWQLLNEWLGRNKSMHVVTLNPEMVMLAEKNSEFKQAMEKADVRVPDGSGLIWARWYLRSDQWMLWPSLVAFTGQPVQRVTGVEAVLSLARAAEKAGAGLFMLGGRKEATQKTQQILQEQFPQLKVAAAADHQCDMSGPTKIIEEINSLKPAVLLVAYGAPKQTLWIDKNLHKLPGVKVAIGVGGAFEIISETLPRAPKWMRRLNLEWLWRLRLEPRRLPRIKVAIIDFPVRVQRQKKARN